MAPFQIRVGEAWKETLSAYKRKITKNEPLICPNFSRKSKIQTSLDMPGEGNIT
jgi:hypothetical protein